MIRKVTAATKGGTVLSCPKLEEAGKLEGPGSAPAHPLFSLVLGLCSSFQSL